MAKLADDRTYFEQGWSRGIVRDTHRSQLPANALYDSADFMLERPGIAYKRGGWSYQSDAFGTTSKATSAIMFLPSPVRVLAVGFNNTVYDITSGTSSSVGALGFTQTGRNPPAFLNKIIMTDGAGVVAAKKVYYSGGLTIAALGGSPPITTGAHTHAGRILLFNPAANPERIYFSGPYDADDVDGSESTWRTDTAYIDTTEGIAGLGSIAGSLLVFGSNTVEKIIGSVPPGVVGEDMALQPVGNVGCIDGRSIVQIDNNVIFASHSGVHITNGAGITSLMERSDASGILSYWQSLFSTSAFGGVAGGMLGRNLFIVSVLNAYASDAATAAATLVCYLPTRSWWRITNLSAAMFARGLTEAGTNRLFAALSNTNRAASLEGILSPAAANKNDGDGSAVAPMMETGNLTPGPLKKADGFARLTYHATDAATDNPTLAITQSKTINAASFAAVPESPLAETTTPLRKRVTLDGDSQARYLKIAQTNASAVTEIYALDGQVRTYPADADGQ